MPTAGRNCLANFPNGGGFIPLYGTRHVPCIRNEPRVGIDEIKANALDLASLGSALQGYIPGEAGVCNSIIETLGCKGDSGEAKVY